MKLLSRGICAILLAGVLSLYCQTRHFEFISCDDSLYVTQNQMFANGTSVELLKKCFTESIASNWHPLTMLSLTVDVWVSQQLGWWKTTGGKTSDSKTAEKGTSGMRAEETWRLDFHNPASAVFHLHNLTLHAFNTLLLFWFLFLIVGHNECSTENPAWGLILAGVGAAFWAWHPLRAESVAWIASRKDVLCVFWYLVGHVAYWYCLQGRYQKEGGLFFAALAYVFAFMAKPTAVVYPVTLFLMDYCLTGSRAWTSGKRVFYGVLAMLTVGFCVIVMSVQKEAMTNSLALPLRIYNAVASVGAYLKSTVYPAELSFFYPYVGPVPFSLMVIGIGFLILVGWFVVCPFVFRFLGEAKRFFLGENESPGPMDWMAFGTMWFLVALIPVIGIVQVGAASRADRYTYLSGIGLSVVLTQILLWTKRYIPNKGIKFFSLVCLIPLVLLGQKSYRQIRLWRNDYVLSEYAISLNFENEAAYSTLGARWCAAGEYDRAFPALCIVGIFRGDDFSFSNLRAAFSHVSPGGGVTLSQSEILSADIHIDDSQPYAQKKHLAYALMARHQKCYSLAEREVRRAIEMDPNDGYAWLVLGTILQAQDFVQVEAALTAFEKSSEHLPSTSRLQPYLRITIKALKKATLNASQS